MSRTVDTRTVEMRFDNKNFESNVKQSMSTLDKLKQKLKMDGASKGLKEIEKSSKKLEFKDLDRSIDNVGKKFSALETIATGVFLKIGMNVADVGAKIIKSFTVDQISSGWNRLANKTSSIQVIMSSLKDDASKFTDEISKMKYVEKWMEKISWFSDETSFDLPALTNGIGKLTSKAVGLEDAVTAVEGMSLWAASAGQNAQTAARMYDQLSQAVGRGYMSTQDWMSVESAQMDITEFEELAIAIAEEKKIIKQGEVTVTNFRNTLSKKWFTKDVQIEAYKRYGEAVDYVIQKQKELADAGIDKNASEILTMLEESNDPIADTLAFKALKRGQEAKTFAESIEATNTAVASAWMNIFETITGNYLEQRKLWTDLSNDLYHIFVDPLNDITEIMSIWNRGFKEGPLDVIDQAYAAGKLDDIHSGYKYISKSAAEAAVETSKVGDEVYYTIETLDDGTQEFVKHVKETSGAYHLYAKKIYDEDKELLSGRTLLIDGFKNIMNAIFLGSEEKVGKQVFRYRSILGALKDAFMEVFFPDLAAAEDGGKKSIAERIYELTKKFKEFTEKLKPLGNKLKNIFKGFFTIFKIIGKFIKAVVKPFKELFSNIFNFKAGDGLLGFMDSISNGIQGLDKYLEDNNVFDKISQGIGEGIEKIISVLDWVSQALTGLSISDLFSELKATIGGLFGDQGLKKKTEGIGSFFRSAIDEISQIDPRNTSQKLTPLQNFWVGVQGILEGVKGIVSFIVHKIIPFLAKAFAEIGSFFGNIFGGLSDKPIEKDAAKASKKVTNTEKEVSPLLKAFLNIFSGVKKFFEKAAPFFEKVGAWIGTVFEKIGEFLGKIAESGVLGQGIKDIAKAGFFVALIFLVKTIKSLVSDFVGIGAAIKGIFTSVSGIFNNINGLVSDFRQKLQKRNKLKTFRSIAVSILLIAAALFLLTEAFKVFAKIEFNNTSAEVIFIIFAAFLGISVGIAALSKKILKEKKDVKVLYSMVGFMIAITVALGLLSNAFKLFSKIEFKNASATNIAIIFGAFIAIVTLVAWAATKFIDSDKALSVLPQMSIFMIAVAAALIPLSIALLIAGSVKADSKALLVIGGIFAAFIGVTLLVAWAASKFIDAYSALTVLPIMSAFMITVSVALILLSAAFAAFSAIDTGNLGTISAVFAGFMVITTGLAILANYTMQNASGILGIVAIAGFMIVAAISLSIVASSFAIMASKLSPSQMDKIIDIVTTLGIIIAILAGIGIIAGMSELGMAGIAVMAAMILAIGVACLTAGVGVYFIAKALDMLISTVAEKGPKFSASMSIMATALVGAFVTFAKNAKNIAAVAALIVLVGLACLIAAPGIAAIGLVVYLIIAAISSLINSFSHLVNAVGENGPRFIDNVGALIDAFLNAIINSAPKMAEAAGVIITAIGNGISNSITSIISSGVIIITALVVGILLAIKALLPVVVYSFIDYINTISNLIRESAPILARAGQGLMEAFIEAVLTGIAAIVEPLPIVGGSIAEEIRSWIPGLREAFNVLDEETENSIGSAIKGVSDNISKSNPTVGVKSDTKASEEAGKEDAESYMSGVLKKECSLSIPTNISILGDSDILNSSLSGLDFGGIMDGQMGDMTQSITDAPPKVNEASTGLAKSVEEPITSLDSFSWGEDIGTGLSDGLLSKLDEITNSSNMTAEVIHDILGFSEPKKGPLSDFHTYVPDMIKLWCKGVKDNLPFVEKNSNLISDKVKESFSSALDYVSGLIDEGMSDELTIRPIMDLSQVQNGVSALDSMMKNRNDYSLYGTVDAASSAAYTMRSNKVSDQPQAVQQTAASQDTFNNTFNITSNDPNAVAEKVSRIIRNQVNRKQAVWAK